MDTKITINIGGMSCAACSAAVERSIRRLNGVSDVNVNIATNNAVIVYDDEKLKISDIKSAIKKAGFKALDAQSDKTESIYKKNTMRPRLILSVVFSALLMYVSMGHMINLPLPEFINPEKNAFFFALTQLVLTIPILISGRDFFIKGTKALFSGSPNMDTLVSIGSTCSFLYSIYSTVLIGLGNTHLAHSLYFESAGMIITFILIGKTLESNSKIKTSQSIFFLMKRAPKTAIVIRNEAEAEIPVDDVREGDVLKILPGMTIPVDSVVKSGVTSVDESMLTGESIPVQKSEGDYLYSGTSNKNGGIIAVAQKTAENSSFAKIIKLIQEAQNSKAPIARLADKISGVFVPTVAAIAFVSALIWLISGKEFSFALNIFISVLVIACPCSLGLATPTAIIAATGNGASKGILIKSGESLELLHKADAVIFDKTGTITKGCPEVTEIITSDFDEDELISLAASAERMSEHPLAEAIVGYADRSANAEKLSCTDFKAFVGNGIGATVDSRNVLIGNKKFMFNNNIDISKLQQKYIDLSEKGNTCVFVAVENRLVGIIAIADTIKENAKDVISYFRSISINTIMLTGDNERVANNIAKSIGIDQVYSELLPDQKAEIIKSLKEEKKTVAMVGDDINDAPALTLADIGIAVKQGSDVTIESADIVLMNDDISTLSKAFDLSKKTIRIIKQNLFWAFIYNSVGIPVAAGILYAFGGILLTPMIGAAAMSLSSVCVVLNSLRLRS